MLLMNFDVMERVVVDLWSDIGFDSFDLWSRQKIYHMLGNSMELKRII